VLDGDGEAAIGLVEPERRLDVRVVQRVHGSGQFPGQPLSGWDIHTRQVDDPSHTWSVPVLEKQPQPLALTPRKGSQELNPPTDHVGDRSTMYPWVRNSGVVDS
jgi:hypothetical protein